jgi:septal ring factor EnvC (AmiA/AmiB activator)
MKQWVILLVVGMFVGGNLLDGTVDLWAARTDQIEKDLSQKKKDLKEIKKELNLTKEKEKQIQGKEVSVLESLHQIENDLAQKGKELKQMEAQLNQMKGRFRHTKDQVHTLNWGMERTKEELSSRLIALYKMGRVAPASFFLTSESYADLLRLDKYFRVILDSDARLVDTFRYQMGLKERYQEELTRDQLQQERGISEMAKKKEEIRKARGEQQALLKAIKHQKVVYQKLIEELEDRGKELQTLIQKLEKDKGLYASKQPSITFKGKLMPPVQGKVISLFKERGQNGIEIQAPAGAQVRAVLPGKVLYADWFKGFGNVIIIDHGDHLFTVSGYISELLKKAGDTVSQGEPVALVGSAGSLKGPCLYFEIRHRGKPQDPTDWIPQLEKVVSLPGGNEKASKEL